VVLMPAATTHHRVV